MRKQIYPYTLCIMVILVLAAAWPAASLASPVTQGAETGFQVSGALLNLEATPGQVYVHEMIVNLGPGAPTMEVTVEARGFAESLSGEFIPLPAEQDNNDYSARPFITQIDNPKFRLEPGEMQSVKATLTIPAALPEHTSYAIIYIHSQPIEMGNGVAQIQAISVPVIVKPKGLNVIRSGEISEFQVPPIEAGKPITLIANVKNTGNHHYKVLGEVKIKDASGQAVANLKLPLSSTSILPTYTQQLQTTYQALDRPDGLTPGTYTAEVQVVYEDGELLDASETQFQISAPYSPCPGIDPAYIYMASFTDEEPGVVDARSQTGVQVIFNTTGKVTGNMAICKYIQAPEVNPPFANDLGQGGTGQTALNYVIVVVEGFNQGRAQLAHQFRQNSLVGVNPNSLFLAYLDGQNWRKLENLSVQTGAELVVGDLPVNVLNNAPLIAMGGASEETQVEAGSTGLTVQTLALVAGIAVFLGLVIGLAIMLAARGRAKRRSA